MSNLVHGFKLNRCELAEAALTTPTVVGPFDPDHDCQSQLLSCPPALAVQDVALQQGEERFHRRVVGAGADPTHRSDQPASPEGSHVLPRAKLTAPVRMDNGA